ncbi:hypothetical protein DEO72_LG8g2551 [Vigna unguiculata]|uniref:Uncharacterized protein n=1 Tax=Vigna unguiculata TaxID=3917 RepID=A0A4D6MXA5_VIGUN|nr:hypothetical protein DEO72_LG8g2551 [Vigna unguiculata]
MEYLAQARVSRLGEKWRKALLLSLTRRLDKRFLPVAKGGLTQASKARSSESARFVLRVMLAQASKFKQRMDG